MVFDFYRSFRHWQDFGQILTFIGDVIFSLISIVILFTFLKELTRLTFAFTLFGEACWA
ncbi:MAG: hypothetical protein NHB14_11575 [Desulfosporosinus sp.]|nr:hypothetical protein [Desulfosporosinus sp.]